MPRGTPWRTRGRRSRGWTGRSRRAPSQRTPFLDQAIGDLTVALDQEEGQKLGGKSAEASRFILRAIGRGLNEA